MRTLPFLAGAALALALSTTLSAQQSVVSPRELDAALEARSRSVESERAVVTRVLSRADVKAIAKDHGLEDRLQEAGARTSQLTDEQLAQVAGYASTIELQLAGGQSVTFTATTLIIILLLVVIIILIAD